MTTRFSGRNTPDPNSKVVGVRCSFPLCPDSVLYRFWDAGIPFCQDHALDMWRRINDMMAAPDAPQPAPPAPDRDPDDYVGWIYYIRIGNRVKIGHSMDPDKRLSSYPPNTELLLMRRGDQKLERAEHRRFGDYLADGREWFHATTEVLQRIEATQHLVPLEDRDLFDARDFGRKRHGPAFRT